jgi:hypothetical protein
MELNPENGGAVGWLLMIGIGQSFPNFYTLRPSQDFALIYAPRGKKRKILYMEHQ